MLALYWDSAIAQTPGLCASHSGPGTLSVPCFFEDCQTATAVVVIISNPAAQLLGSLVP
jgi:hypothetical protein